jgi:hypothetical protein
LFCVVYERIGINSCVQSSTRLLKLSNYSRLHRMSAYFCRGPFFRCIVIINFRGAPLRLPLFPVFRSFLDFWGWRAGLICLGWRLHDIWTRVALKCCPKPNYSISSFKKLLYTKQANVPTKVNPTEQNTTAGAGNREVTFSTHVMRQREFLLGQ